MKSEQSVVSSEQLAVGSEALLACPFCGGEPRMHSGTNDCWLACDCDEYGPHCASRVDAEAAWNIWAAKEAAYKRARRDELVSVIRWTRPGSGRLPAYGHTVAIWLQKMGIVIRAYRDSRGPGDGWRHCGDNGDGPRYIDDAFVTAYAEIPAGVLPAPDGGAA